MSNEFLIDSIQISYIGCKGRSVHSGVLYWRFGNQINHDFHSGMNNINIGGRETLYSAELMLASGERRGEDHTQDLIQIIIIPDNILINSNRIRGILLLLIYCCWETMLACLLGIPLRSQSPAQVHRASYFPSTALGWHFSWSVFASVCVIT